MGTASRRYVQPKQDRLFKMPAASAIRQTPSSVSFKSLFQQSDLCLRLFAASKRGNSHAFSTSSQKHQTRDFQHGTRTSISSGLFTKLYRVPHQVTLLLLSPAKESQNFALTSYHTFTTSRTLSQSSKSSHSMSQFKKEITQQGDGSTYPKKGDTVTMEYTGMEVRHRWCG